MAATTLSPARAIRPPRRLNWRAIFGVFLLFLATGSSLAFWTLTADARDVVVTTRDLPAGAALTPADLAIARVRVDDAIYQAAIPSSDLGSLVGKQLGQPVYAHQLLARPQLSDRPALGPDQRALTIAISPDTAVGGRLHPGDSVQVFWTVNKDKPEAKTKLVLARATVYDVGHQQPLAVVNADPAAPAAAPGPIQWLTLVVTQDQAQQLAQARWSGALDVALLPPTQQ